MAKSKRALITGANGFVGQHLIPYLKKQKIEPIVFPREVFLHPNLEDYIKSLSPSYIFHLAAAGNITGKHDDVDIFSVNLGYTFNLLQALKDIKIEGIVNVSTSSIWLPFQTTYSATKFGAESLCKAYVDQYNLPIVTMRPFSLYGEGDHEEHLIPVLFRACLYHEQIELSERPVHDWTYVGDFVEQMVNYAKRGEEFKGQIIHVGTGKATSNYWLAKEIEALTSRRPNIVGTLFPKPYDTQDWRAQSYMGHVEYATTSLQEGLQKVYNSYKL